MTRRSAAHIRKRGRLAAAILAGLVCLAGGAACADQESYSPDAESSLPEAVSPADLVTGPSPVVGIRAVGCGLAPAIGSGLGFPIDDIVLTTAHTVAGATDIQVVDVAGQSVPATVRYFDPTKDIAALHVESLEGIQLDLARAELGESAWILGWRRSVPGGERSFQALPGSVTRRLLVTIEDIWVQGSYERNAIEVSSEVVAGDSGAAVLSELGGVIGMVYASSRERQVAFALDDVEMAAALAGAATSARPVANGRCP